MDDNELFFTNATNAMTAHTWTLSIEIWTGLLMLVAIKKISREKFKIGMIVFLIVGIMYRTLTIYLGCDVYIVSLCLLAHLDAFACGSLLAISIQDVSMKRNLLLVLGAVGCIGIMSCIVIIAKNANVSFFEGYCMLASSKNYLDNCFTGNIYFFISLLTCSILGLIVCNNKKSRDDEKKKYFYRFIVYIGNVSYGLYLFHWPILMVLNRFITAWYTLLPAVFIGTLIAVVVFEKCRVEIKKRKRGYENDSIA